MSAKLDMANVLRLTRDGRLGEATALIRSGLSRLMPDAGAEPHADARQVARPRIVTAGWPAQEAEQDKAEQERADRAEAPEPTREAKAGRFTQHRVQTEGGFLAYKLYVPSDTGRRGAMPLVVMLHGCTQDPDDFAAGTRMNALAEDHGFVVAYPEQPRSANFQRCWNWFKAGDQVRDSGEPALIAAATRQILAEQRVDPDKVFVAGLSAGGAAAAIMGCAYPDLFAGVGVHSGLACGSAKDLGSALATMRGGPRPATMVVGVETAPPTSLVPTIVFHGTADNTVNVLNARAVAEQAGAGKAEGIGERGVSAAGVPFVRTTRRDRRGRIVGEVWMVEGAGHAWSGGSAAGSYTDPRGPDASLAMLRFFGIAPAESSATAPKAARRT